MTLQLTLKDIAVVILVVVTGIVFLAYQESRFSKLENQNLLLQQNLQTAQLEIGRAKTEISGNLKKDLDKLSETLQKRIKETESEVESLQAITLSLKTHVKGKLDLSIPPLPQKEGGCPSCRKDFRYQDFRLSLYGNLESEELKYTLNQRFTGQLIRTVNPDGSVSNYAEFFEITPDGNNKLDLQDYTVLIKDNTQPRFWWNIPKIDLGLELYSPIPNLSIKPSAFFGISILGWGNTSENLTWRFLRVGSSINSEGANLSVSPIIYNIAELLPLVDNIWLGFSIGYAFPALSFSTGISLTAIL